MTLYLVSVSYQSSVESDLSVWQVLKRLYSFYYIPFIIFICPTYSQYFCLSNYKNIKVLCSFPSIFRSLIFNSKNLKRILFQAFFTILLMYLSQQNHALHMPRSNTLDVLVHIRPLHSTRLSLHGDISISWGRSNRLDVKRLTK